MQCLKCGEYEGSYCEKCFQDVIAENARLQMEIKNLKDMLQNDNYENHIPRID